MILEFLRWAAGVYDYRAIVTSRLVLRGMGSLLGEEQMYERSEVQKRMYHAEGWLMLRAVAYVGLSISAIGALFAR